MVEDTLKREEDFVTIYYFNAGSELLAKYVADAFNDIAEHGRMVDEKGLKYKQRKSEEAK